ncbi:MAG: ABC transporter permease, partial [Chloroflexi bacterium]|nr:ABC transporter permease [Chloroflexota bacterium]
MRTHLRRPAVAIVTSISLGLGVGVATTMYSVGHSLLGRALSVDDPERVVRAVRDPAGVAIFSGPELERLQAASAGVAEWVGHQMNEAVYHVGDGPPARAWFEMVGPRYFALFGGGIAHGRYPADDGVGADREVLLSHAFWTRLGADPGLLGDALSLNGEPFTITGVAPPGFRGTLPGLRVDLWAPLSAQLVLLPRSGSLTSEQDRFLFATGRLLPGSDRDRLDARLAGMVLEPMAGGGSSASSPHAEAAAGLLPLIQRV